MSYKEFDKNYMTAKEQADAIDNLLLTKSFPLSRAGKQIKYTTECYISADKEHYV